jgi:hypothetical protein
MIGIDPNTRLVYEGLNFHGHGLWPAPLLLRATLVLDEGDWSKVPTRGDLREANCVFREDYFDPVTRIRRGRFYDTAGNRSQPDNWYVHKHPVIPDDVGHQNHQGLFSKSLVTFTPMQRLGEVLQQARDPVVVLGAQPAVTPWCVLAVERAGNDEDVVTLKARLSFGFLPELLTDSIPQAGRQRVVQAVGKVVDAAHRQSGIALVDLCRAAATVVLAEWLAAAGEPAADVRELDLGKLVGKLPQDVVLRRSAAEIVNRLHPRGKPNEQLRRGTRDVTESDGVLALEALGFLLRELEWAR